MSGDIPTTEPLMSAPSRAELGSKTKGTILKPATNSGTTESNGARVSVRASQVKDSARAAHARVANSTTTITRVGFGTSSSRAPITPVAKRYSLNLTSSTVSSSATNRDTTFTEAEVPATRNSVSRYTKRSVSSTVHTTPTTAEINRRTTGALIAENGIPEGNRSKALLEQSQERIRRARNSLAVRAEQVSASRYPSITSMNSSSSTAPNDNSSTAPKSARKIVPTHFGARNSLAPSDSQNLSLTRLHPTTKSTLSRSISLSPLAPSNSIVNTRTRPRLKVGDGDRNSVKHHSPPSAKPPSRAVQVSRSTEPNTSSYSLRGVPARSSSSWHSNGLGARTVSPTDAHRRKVLSLSSPIQPVGHGKADVMHSLIRTPDKCPPTESKAAELRSHACSSFNDSKAESTSRRRSAIVSPEDIPPVPPLPSETSMGPQINPSHSKVKTPERDISMQRRSSYVNPNGPATEPRHHTRQYSTGSRDIDPSLMPPLNLAALSAKTVSRVNALPKSDANVEKPPIVSGVRKVATGSVKGTEAGKLGLAASSARTIRSLKGGESNTSELATLQRTLRRGGNPSKLSLPGSPSSIPVPSPSVLQGIESTTDTMALAHEGKDFMDYVPSSESPSGKEISAERRSHAPHTSSSIRQKLTRTLKRPLEGAHMATNQDYSGVFSSAPPTLLALSEKSQPFVPPRHTKITAPASPTTSIPSPSKRSLALARLAAFKDRALAELSPTKSSLSPSSLEMGSPRVWIAEKELEMLDDSDDVAEQEMKVISGRHRRTDDLARQLADYKRNKSKPIPGITVSHAIRTEKLNAYEKGEILDFRTVYFCGTPNCCKTAGHADPSTNFGFDDERGDYKIIVGDHLAYRYEILGVLGKGSFGQVVKCIDHKTGGLTAVKIIRNKKRFHAQALVETKILQNLCEWDPDDTHHFVRVTHNFYFRGHLCIATELLSLNLYEFVKENEFKGLSLPIIRRFAKQILSALCLLQRKSVIHCDLKPENILLLTPESAEIKVIDFGSSCFERERVFTYIQSRFYRSPEVILGLQYGLPIDMWSLGCILAELQLGYPIFPGENEQEQLGCIMEIFGPPANHIVEKASRKKLFFESSGRPRLVVSSKGRRRLPNSKALPQVLHTDDAAFIDFIASCLRWDPELRLKPDDAVRHPFITGKKMELQAPAKVITGNYTYQNQNISASSVPGFHSSGRVVGGRPLPDLPKSRIYNSSPSQTPLSVAQVIGMRHNSSQFRPPQGAGSAVSTPYHSARSTMTPNSGTSINSTVPNLMNSRRPSLISPSKSFASSSAIQTMPTLSSNKGLSIESNYVPPNGLSNIPRITSSSTSARVVSSTPPGSVLFGSTRSTPASRARAA